MKRILTLILMILLVMAFAYARDAPRNNLTTSDAPLINGLGKNITGPSFAEQQSRMIANIDKVIAKLNDAEIKMLASPKLNAEVKQTITEAFNTVIAGLNEYKAKVQAATTSEELKQINAETKEYIKANKDIIKANALIAATAHAQQAYNSTLALINKVQLMIPVLKLTCKEEASALTSLDSELTSLENELPKLQTAMQSKNKMAMQSEIKALSTLAKTMVTTVKEIKVGCPQLQNLTKALK